MYTMTMEAFLSLLHKEGELLLVDANREAATKARAAGMVTFTDKRTRHAGYDSRVRTTIREASSHNLKGSTQ